MVDVLSPAAAEAYLADSCFTTGPAERVGIEIEHVVHDRDHWSRTVSAQRLDELIAGLELPAGGTVSREPGGQLELSTLPHVGAAAAIRAADHDLDRLHRSADEHSLVLIGEGTDPFRAPQRTLRHPRYDAMESYLDTWSPAGRQMMCSTAAVQITVEAGQRPRDIAPTWDLLHAVGPTLVAMFANSPYLQGRSTGWKCTRQAIWWALDPLRTGPAHSPSTLARTPVDEYTDYVLAAPVMLVRCDGDRWQPTPGLTFRGWLDGDGDGTLRPPTQADLHYHLTTLFPPVRARGALEVRYLDAQRGRDWAVPVALLGGLLADAATIDAARAVVDPVVDCWTEAARIALADPLLARAATELLTIARSALGRTTTNHELVTLLDEFDAAYVERGRCPADDLLAGDALPNRAQR